MTEPLNAPPRQSVGDLLGDVTRDISTLIRQEVELAKAEITQSAKQAAKGGSMFAGAAVAGHFVLLFLSIAVWWALGDAMDSWPWSAVIVAVVWGIVAAVLAARGRAESKRVGGLPRTTDSVKKIPNALQGHEEKNS
ncbi:phage holin family protein [Cellulomonas sp. URHD0024]|uniref:phage holin family protein n=1 Tax=Cellulomonas sp. URHD0024 TaxID=1302620 RepID=UPI000411F348|nr:phage holin family protein [Cellulomonas sp. URHD0024]